MKLRLYPHFVDIDDDTILLDIVFPIDLRSLGQFDGVFEL